MFFTWIGIGVVSLLSAIGTLVVLCFLILGAWPGSQLSSALRQHFGKGRVPIVSVTARPELRQEQQQREGRRA